MPIAIIGAVVGAASLGNAIYNETNQPSSPNFPGYTAQAPETPEERQFYEQQTLAAENAAAQEEAAATIQANNSQTFTNYVEYGAIAIVLFLVWSVLRREKFL